MQSFYTSYRIQGFKKGLERISFALLLTWLSALALAAQSTSSSSTDETVRYNIHPLSISTPYSEMAPTIGPEGQLLFSSTRPIRTIIKRFNSKNQQPFYHIWESPVVNLTTFGRAQAFEPRLQIPLNNGPISFSADGRQMYVTRNTEGRNAMELDIVLFNRIYDKWTRDASSLPLKIKGYSIMHPSISPDNQRLYFASDMPGGYGGMDLYYSVRRGGFLSRPVNLGPTINTPGNEIFPYVDTDGRLFFASDGQPGLGGLDIFVAQIVEDNFSPPLNMGPGINSPADDFGLVWYQTGQSGYFASNRPGGLGQDDLYAFDSRPTLDLTLIKGKVVNEERAEPEAEVLISVLLPNQTVFQETTSATDGTFSLLLWGEVPYTFIFSREGFTTLRKSTRPAGLKTPLMLSPTAPASTDTTAPKDSLLQLQNQWH